MVSESQLLAANNAVSSKQANDLDMGIKIGAHIDWEHLLSPAPLSIGLLGDLMIMSSKTRDFRIDGELPKVGKINYVKYPHSFRATLVQIANGGHRAFMVAHTNMDKIKLLMGDVPAYMKEATEIIVQADTDIIRDFLPAPMSRIREAATASVSLSIAVVWQFEHVMNLTSEVLEMCTSEKSIQEAQLDSNIDRQQILNITIPSYQKVLDHLNQTMAKDTAMMERAEDDMRVALKNMPSGWQMIGMDFVQSICNIITLNTMNRMASDGESQWNDQQSNSNTTEENPESPKFCILKYSKNVNDVCGMAQHFHNIYKDLEDIDSAKNGKYDSKKDLTKFNKMNTDGECEPLDDVIEQGIAFITKLADTVQGKKPKNFTEEQFTESRQFNFDQALAMVKEFKKTACRMQNWLISNQQPLPYRTPMLSHAQKAKQKTNSQMAASQQAMAASRYKADMAQATLMNTRQSIEKTRDLMMKQNEDFIKLIREQQQLNLDKIRYDQIIKALQEGILKLSILKEHWTKLVQLFQEIANIVEHVAAKSVEDFAVRIDTTSKNVTNIYKKVIMDGLYAKAAKATQTASFVHNMAKTYISVSTQYIMPNVAGLGKLIVTDPKTADNDRAILLEKCAADSRAIVNLITNDKNLIAAKIEKRMNDFKREFAFLEEIRIKQIAEIRRKANLEMQKIKNISPEEKAKRVEEIVQDKVENNDFLKNGTVAIPDSEDYDETGPKAEEFY